MIRGQVTAGREAIIPLQLKGTNDLECTLEAVIDTGFTEHLTLSQSWIAALKLPQLQINSLFLADESEVEVGLYRCSVVWDGQEIVIPVHSLEGSPLVGMSLLNHLLVAEVTEGGAGTLSPLP
jgi:clan AA aspartic protease